MADVAAPVPVELASGIGENNSEGLLQTDAEALKAFQTKIVDAVPATSNEQGGEALSLMNAASPTPLGKPVTPPISETLSNVGKVEPAQMGQASIALESQVPPAPSNTDLTSATSVMDNTNAQQQAAQAGQVATPGSSLEGTINNAYGAQMGANNAIAKAVEAKAAADQAAFANAEQAYVKAEAERVVTKQKFDNDYNGKMADYEKSIADYKQAAGEKVIPGKLLGNMDTGQRLQAGLFMALSSYGAAISGQENQALKVINNAINQDIDAQKFNIENKLKGARMGVDGTQYMMSQMRAKFGDDESATLATRAAMLAMTQQQLNTNASKLDAATAKPKAQALNSQLEMQKQQVLGELKKAQAQQFMLNKVSSGNNKILNPAELSAMETVDKGFRDRWVQGYGSAANKEQAGKFTEYASEITPAIEGLGRIQDLAKNFNRFTDLKKRAEIQTELAAVLGALRIPITGPGILTESERKDILDKVIGNPNAIAELPSLMKAKLQTTLNKLNTDLASRGKIAGLPEDSFKKPTSDKYFY